MRPPAGIIGTVLSGSRIDIFRSIIRQLPALPMGNKIPAATRR